MLWYASSLNHMTNEFESDMTVPVWTFPPFDESWRTGNTRACEQCIKNTPKKANLSSFVIRAVSDHLITYESQALSSCTPWSIVMDTSCWPVGPLWCKFRAAPEKRGIICVISEVLARIKCQTRYLPDSVDCRCVCDSGSIRQFWLCITLTSIQEKPNVVHTGSLSTNHNPTPFFASYFLLYSCIFYYIIFFITFMVLHMNRRLPTADYIF